MESQNNSLSTEDSNSICVSMQLVNGKMIPAVTSLNVAKVFGKEHKNVLQSIKNTIDSCNSLKSFTGLNFKLSKYKDSTGRELPMYLLDKNMFSLVAMGYTGEKAMSFKLAYIAKFNEMEAMLSTNIESMLSDPDTLIQVLTKYRDEKNARIRAERCLADSEKERDQAIKARSWISSKREATAMATAAKAVKKNQKLTEENAQLKSALGTGGSWKRVNAISEFWKRFKKR